MAQIAAPAKKARRGHASDVSSGPVHAYTRDDVARICKVSTARLRYWERSAVLEPGGGAHPGTRFGYSDLVLVRQLLQLLEGGVPLPRIRRSLEAVRRSMPELERPLAALRLWGTGPPRVVVRHGGVLLEPDGQAVLDFGSGTLESPRVAPLRADGGREIAVRHREHALEWFERGCKLDSHRSTYAEAAEAYRRAIEADPDFADAHCNLGAVYFNQDRPAMARESFDRALDLEPGHVEANLNLATLLEEEGRSEDALRHYKRALASDPLHADTHVSLALIYERLGLRRRAREFWRRYLGLDPGGTWSDIARKRLQET
jgi:DNA-binding transcriptional MerR regulator